MMSPIARKSGYMLKSGARTIQRGGKAEKTIKGTVKNLLGGKETKICRLKKIGIAAKLQRGVRRGQTPGVRGKEN